MHEQITSLLSGSDESLFSDTPQCKDNRDNIDSHCPPEMPTDLTSINSQPPTPSLIDFPDQTSSPHPSPLPPKTVTFVSPVKPSPRRFYDTLDETALEMNDRYNTILKTRFNSPYSEADADFKLNTRRRSTQHPVEQIKKRTSVLAHRPLPSLPASSTDLLSPEASPQASQRTASNASSRSLASRLSLLNLTNNSKRLSRQESPTFTIAISPPDLTDLPSSRTALEGRINYHISRLDRLKRRIADLNNAIRQDAAEYAVSIKNLERQRMTLAVKDLNSQIDWLRQCREGLRPSVAFHREELNRIARKRMELDREDDVEPTLPAVYAGLDGDDVWDERLAV